MQYFHSFVDRKHRKAIKELKTIDEVLTMAGFKVKKFFEDKFDPYIFVASNADTPFGGIRIYKIESTIAYRAQNEEKTHPYGKAFNIDVEGIFEDYLEDDEEGDKIGEMVAKAIAEDVRFFFKKNAELYSPYAQFDKDKTDKPQIMTPPVGGADKFRADGAWS
jgi:hypothetical protein